MKLFGEVKGYIIHKPDGGNYTLCKILKEYGYEKEDKESKRIITRRILKTGRI